MYLTEELLVADALQIRGGSLEDHEYEWMNVYYHTGQIGQLGIVSDAVPGGCGFKSL